MSISSLFYVYFITILSLFYHYFMSILSMCKIRVYGIDNKEKMYGKPSALRAKCKMSPFYCPEARIGINNVPG